MNNDRKTLFKAAIITMSFVQTGSSGIAPILSQIGEAFPQASATRIQFLMTFPAIFSLVFTIVSALLSDVFPKKKLALAGLATVGAGGVLAFLFHGSLGILFLWAAVIGIGIGMVAPVAPALVNETFKDREKNTMLGFQSSAATLGGMLMSFAGGYLALSGWRFGYLVYLVGIPGLIITLFGVPRDSRTSSVSSETMQRGRFCLVVWKEIILTVLLLMVFSSFPTNIAMLVTERSLGDTSLSGILTTVFMLGGLVSGVLYGKIASVLKQYTAPAGPLILGAGALIVALSYNVPMLMIGCFAGGFGTLMMPSNMAAAGRLPGYETLNSALIMGASFVGAFLAPVFTSISAAITGSGSVTYRFLTVMVTALILTILAVIMRDRKTAGN